MPNMTITFRAHARAAVPSRLELAHRAIVNADYEDAAEPLVRAARCCGQHGHVDSWKSFLMFPRTTSGTWIGKDTEKRCDKKGDDGTFADEGCAQSAPFLRVYIESTRHISSVGTNRRRQARFRAGSAPLPRLLRRRLPLPRRRARTVIRGS